ncbi:MAG: type I phosphomannose isomerase catalytic subunit [Planctomycetota bacterium]
MPDLAPIVFEPILLPKVWGGGALAAYGKPLPAGERIGESWEVADLASTAASGAGGSAQRSVVSAGPLAGRTLGELMTAFGPDLLGDAKPSAAGGFPLLVKLLDARETLSVQVHPSPAYVAANPGAHFKTECWYVLDAEDDALIYKGLRPGVSAEDLKAAVTDGRVPEVLASEPAVPGELHELPSGTIHALGAGVVAAEFQTPSDTTFRVYDWAQELDRSPRELHVEQALASMDLAEPPAAATGPGTLCENDFFRVREVRGHCEEVGLAMTGCAVVMIVGGKGASIASASDAFEEVPGRPGSTVLVPAACAADAVLRARPGTVCLVCEVHTGG